MASELLIKIAAEFAGLKNGLAGAASAVSGFGKSAADEGRRAAAAFDQATASAKQLEAAAARATTAQGRAAAAGRTSSAAQPAAAAKSTATGQAAASAAGALAGSAAAAKGEEALASAHDKAGKSAKGHANEEAGLAGSITKTVESAKRLVEAFLAFEGVKKLVELSDEASNLSARLKLVTTSQADFNAVFFRLFDVAQSRGQAFETLVELYARMRNATKDLGTSQEALLGVTEAVDAAITVSGVSAGQAQNGLIQLSQAFSVGKLQGQDLKAVLEDIPTLGQAIAQGLGLTVAQFRKLAEQGNLSTDKVIQALLKQKKVLVDQAQSVPPTFAKAFAQLGNSALLAVTTVKEVFGKGNGIASALSSFAKALSAPEVIAGLAEFATKIKVFAGQIFDGFASIARDAVPVAQQVADELALEVKRINDIFKVTPGQGTASDFGEFIIKAFRELPENIRAFTQLATVEVAHFIESTKISFGGLADYAKAIFTDTTFESIRKRLLAEQVANDQIRLESIDGILKERQANVDAAKAVNDKAKADRAAAIAARGKVTPGTPAAQLADAKAQAEAAAKLVKDAVDRALREVQGLYDNNLLTAEQFLSRRTALQLASINAEIEVQRRLAANAKDANEKLAANTQIELLSRQRIDVARQEAEDRLKIEKDADAKILDARAKTAELQGQAGLAANIKLGQQYQELIDSLVRSGQTAGAELARGLFNRDLAKSAADALVADSTRALEKLQEKLAQIQEQQASGIIDVGTADERQRQARAETIAQLQQIQDKLGELKATNPDVQAVSDSADKLGASLRTLGQEGATGLDLAVRNLRTSLADLDKQFAANAANAGVDALSQFFTDIVTKGKTAGEALRDFVLNFATAMLNIATRALATFLVLQGLDAIYPGLGKLTIGAAAASTSAPVKHAGGMVGGSGPSRSVSLLLFAAAPRYHSGGMVGLAPGEVPIIAQQGEEVLARNDPRNAANGGASGGNVRIINAVDPSVTEDHMSAPGGERVILNVIQKNRGSIRQVLK